MFLNNHSYYSLRYGTISIKELINKAKKANVQAMALTDINNSTGVFEFVKSCRKENIQAIVGMDFQDKEEQLFVALAKNTQGFGEMNEWLTDINMGHKAHSYTAPAANDVFVVYPFENAPRRLRENEYIGVRVEQLNKLYNSPLNKYKDRLIIHHPVTVDADRDSFRLHKILRAIDNNTLISMLQDKSLCRENEQMQSVDFLREQYINHPHILRNTEKLISDCSFDFNFMKSKNKATYTNSLASDKLLLESLAMDGLAQKYGKDNTEAYERAKKELEIIHNMGFSAYFLITWDIIRYSQSRGFYHVGRGSGANSIVSYALGITNVCPLELDLYFERFLNPNRTSPPDFDIDWSWQFRDEILNYIFKRFDGKNTAFIGTVTHFKHRSIVREIGKTLGLPKEDLDEMSRQAHDQHPDNKIVRAIHKFGKKLEYFPNMRSIHACGVLISEKPITAYSALEMPPKGFPTTQFDMYTGEDIGFEKLDILGQRGIGHIDDCVKLVQERTKVKVDIHSRLDKLKYDKQANEMLREGKTLGCFYIESPAMRGVLKRLKCDNYPILVAATSIIRPGVAKSGMLREYISRHNNPGSFKYLHDAFQEHLGETYGIMVYQEDVIKIAHYFGGLDLADGDILRRAMSGKTRSREEFLNIRQRFIDNCKAKGYPDELTTEVYRQIESFAGYSFCKAHSASYSVESYQSLYLKAYYPMEFMVSVLNNFGGFYQAEIYFHEAKRLGAKVHPPCVNKSRYLTTLHGKNEIYVGFNYLKNLEKKVAGVIEIERLKRGPFQSLQDFLYRIPISLESLEVLIFSGGFAFTGKLKNELALEARMLINQAVVSQQQLFYEAPKTFELPTLDRSPREDAFDEMELIGFPVSYTPFELLKTDYRGKHFTKDFNNMENKIIEIVGYFIARKDVRTVKGLMNFGTWFDYNGDFFDTTHFPDNLRKYPLKGKGCYKITGKVVIEFGQASIEVHSMQKMAYISDPRYPE